MRLRLWQVDAFAERPFSGNPAAVVPLDAWLDDRLLMAIAAENNLSETAFFVPEGTGYRLRWFTPAVEVDLCGHATLATAHVILHVLQPGRADVSFATRSGTLTVRRVAQGLAMTLPATPVTDFSVPDGLVRALGVAPLATFAAPNWLLVELSGAAAVKALRPDFAALIPFARNGVIATAPAEAPIDFVSRMFGPALGVDEDPVTGAAHCLLAPFWAKRLGRNPLRAHQASSRGGHLLCYDEGATVTLVGRCVPYLEGMIDVDPAAFDGDRAA